MLTVMKIHYEHAVIDSIFDDHYCVWFYAQSKLACKTYWQDESKRG